MRRRTEPDPHDADRSESGAVMVLALVFLVAVTMTTLSILGYAGASLFDTGTLQNQRAMQYGAEAAVQGAIQTVRYQAPTSALQQNCTFPTTTTSVTINGFNFVVKCTISIPPGFYGRNVTFNGCLANGSSCARTIVTAKAVFNDVNPLCKSGASYGCYGAGPWGSGFWGTTATVTNWVVKATGSG
jgi:hypothetical protein